MNPTHTAESNWFKECLTAGVLSCLSKCLTTVPSDSGNNFRKVESMKKKTIETRDKRKQHMEKKKKKNFGDWFKKYGNKKRSLPN